MALSTVKTGAGVCVTVAALAGCGGAAPSLQPAPGATSRDCLTALDRAPLTVLDAARTPIDTQGALSWGSPAVVVRCGLEEIAPTTATCLEVNGVDWVVETDADPLIAISYGRAPALEVRVPAELGQDALPTALVDVEPIAAALPTTGRACIG